MIRKLVEIFKSKELRERIFFTLGIFLVFKIGTTLIVPGITPDIIEFKDGDLFSLMNVLGGNSLQNFSLFALGISPYITSSIIIQLLSMMEILPKLSELSKQGEKGRKKLDNATRYLTIILAAVQGFGTIKLMEGYGLKPVHGGIFTTWDYIYITITIVAGSMFVLWLADRISSKGIGNGVSMIIAAGIVSTIPTQMMAAYNNFIDFGLSNNVIISGIISFMIYLLAYLLFILFIVFIEKSVRKVPLQHSQNTTKPGDVHHLPVKLNPAGVIPVIFSSSFMMAIVTIASMFGSENKTATLISQIFNMSADVNGVYWGLMIYVFLIIVFTFFWSNMQLDPAKLSENLAQNNSYIPGIRQGRETENYLSKVINRVAAVGGLTLSAVAALPILLTIWFDLNSSIAFGGTSLIIVVGVALETYEQVKSKLAGKEYKGFGKRGA